MYSEHRQYNIVDNNIEIILSAESAAEHRSPGSLSTSVFHDALLEITLLLYKP